VQRDAEKGKLKATRDSQRCTPVEVAKDEKTRMACKNIWEAAKEGDVDTLVKCIAQAGNGGAQRKPWIAAGLEDQTWESGFRVIHSAILGHGMRVKRVGAAGGAEKRSADKTIQTVCLLLDKHSFVNGMDKSCRTPMHFAAV
jgi:hypothetical protein